jgi:peptidoglycan/LPS O-acetylase OafA/YrhL
VIEKVVGINLIGFTPGLSINDTLDGGNMIYLGGQLQGDILCLVYLALVIVVSRFTYKYIEMPWQTRVSRGCALMLAHKRLASRAAV